MGVSLSLSRAVSAYNGIYTAAHAREKRPYIYRNSTSSLARLFAPFPPLRNNGLGAPTRADSPRDVAARFYVCIDIYMYMEVQRVECAFVYTEYRAAYGGNYDSRAMGVAAAASRPFSSCECRRKSRALLAIATGCLDTDLSLSLLFLRSV